jgi:hypothetical protein
MRRSHGDGADDGGDGLSARSEGHGDAMLETEEI